jgi:hypothetical protein
MQTPWGDFAVSDAHVHFFSRRFFEALGTQGGKSAEEMAGAIGWLLPPQDPAELARAWAAELDGYGVARAALIASMPGDEASVETALAACPGRFFGFPTTGKHAVERTNRLAACRPWPVSRDAAVRCTPGGVAGCAVRPRGRAVFVHGRLEGERSWSSSLSTCVFQTHSDLCAAALRHPGLRFVIPSFRRCHAQR